MTQSPLSKFLSGKINWQESYASLILGAIIVIILGLLVANFLTRRGQQQIDGGEQVSQPTQQEIGTAGGEYKTVAGDSLSAISQKFYQTEEFWPQLAQANKIANPNVLFVDLSLKIPAKSEVESLRGQQVATTYNVASGETFFTIAEKVYRDGSKWPVLHQANGSQRLPNGNPLVFADSTIVVPR